MKLKVGTIIQASDYCSIGQYVTAVGKLKYLYQTINTQTGEIRDELEFSWCLDSLHDNFKIVPPEEMPWLKRFIVWLTNLKKISFLK